MSAQRAQTTAGNSVPILVALSHVTVILVTDLSQMDTVAVVSLYYLMYSHWRLLTLFGCYDY